MQVLSGSTDSASCELSVGRRENWIRIYDLFEHAYSTPDGPSSQISIHAAGVYGHNPRGGVDRRPRDTHMGILFPLLSGEENVTAMRRINSSTDENLPITLTLPHMTLASAEKICQLVVGGKDDCVQGKTVSVMLLEEGSVEAANTPLHPHNETLVVLAGEIMVSLWPSDSSSPVIPTSNVDVFSLNSGSQNLISQNYLPQIFKLAKGDTLHLRAGFYATHLARENSGVCPPPNV